MPLFSSARERRLWIMTLVVVLTIYLTLALAPQLVGLVNEGVLTAAFLGCLILVGLTILTQGLKVRPSGKEIGIVLGIALVYIMLGVRMALPERSHLMEYGVVAVLIYEALVERVKQDRHVPFPAFWAFLLTSLIGLIDECIQLVLPNRVFDTDDILFNVLAAFTAILGMVALRWVRDRTDSSRKDASDKATKL